LLVFLAAQGSDVVQSVAGLWLIPRFVPASDIGAVLPLTQSAILLALPLGVLMVPVSRWLTIYAVNGERGKLKALLVAALLGTLLAVTVMTAVAALVLPWLFKAVRVSEPGLPAVLLAAGATGAVVPVFSRSLQGLKRFGTVACAGFIAAPLRLLVSVAVMPVRAVSGYLAGMTVASLAQIAVSWLGVRREIRTDDPARNFWREDGRAMLRYAAPLVLAATVWNSLGMLQSVLIRVNLPEVESAAYYVITQFGNVGGWFGNAVLFVAFPFVATAQARGESPLPVLVKSLAATLAVGGLVALAVWPFAGSLLASSESWRRYVDYAVCLPLWALRATMGAAIGCFMGCEQAAGSFRYLAYLVPCVLVESLGLFFLHDIVSFVVWFVAMAAVQMILVFLVIWRRRRLGHVA